MQAKTERFEMRLEQSTLDRLDGWRGRQADLPSRAEAARRLIDIGLGEEGSENVRLSDGEKLVLLTLCDLHKQSRIKGETDPDFIISALAGGHYWGLRWQYPGIFDVREDDPAVVSEVIDVLEMWSVIETSYRRLPSKAKSQTARGRAALDDEVTFLGFDGNNERAHFSVANFLIKDMERFRAFGGRDLNSHMPMIEGYRRMLHVFRPMRGTLKGGDLSASQITEILGSDDAH